MITKRLHKIGFRIDFEKCKSTIYYFCNRILFHFFTLNRKTTKYILANIAVNFILKDQEINKEKVCLWENKPLVNIKSGFRWLNTLLLYTTLCKLCEHKNSCPIEKYKLFWFWSEKQICSSFHPQGSEGHHNVIFHPWEVMQANDKQSNPTSSFSVLQHQMKSPEFSWPQCYERLLIMYIPIVVLKKYKSTRPFLFSLVTSVRLSQLFQLVIVTSSLFLFFSGLLSLRKFLEWHHPA